MMIGIREYWRHTENDAVYVIESTQAGEVIAAAGPLPAEDLPQAADCQCSAKINIWVKRAIAENKLRRFNPKST